MDPQQQPMNNVQPESPQPPLTPSEPPKNKKNMLVIAIVVAAIVIISAIAFALYSSNKGSGDKNNDSTSTSTSNTANPDSDKYQKYDVTDAPSGVNFSVFFYKDAKVEEQNGRTYLNSGETGSMHSVYLGVATSETIDCGESATTTMKLSGESTTVCYDSDNTQYAGYAKAKDGLVKINLAGQKPISLDEAKAIMESVTFN